MRIAVLADVHGNLPALDAVLREAEAAGVDLVVANGDLADGPFPRETLDRLMELDDRWFGLRGNGDRWLVEAAEGRYRPRDPETDQVIRWASDQLTPSHRAMLKALPLSRTLEHPRLGRLGFCHASARADDEMVLVDSALSRFSRCLSSLDAPTVFLGHTHMPFVRLVDRRQVINTGSVGMPYGHTGAAWALVDGEITLKRTCYDLHAAARLIAASNMPGAEAFARDNVSTTAGDGEALAAWHAVEARQAAAEPRDPAAGLDSPTLQEADSAAHRARS